MHQRLLRLTSSDSIRAQIQREEIDKIIQDQKRRKEEQNAKRMSQISFSNKNKKSPESKNLNHSNPSFRSRIKKSPHSKKKEEERAVTNYSLNEQISYFSVKKHY